MAVLSEDFVDLVKRIASPLARRASVHHTTDPSFEVVGDSAACHRDLIYIRMAVE